MSTLKTEQFSQSYLQLQKSVQKLRSTEVSNIDDLVEIVDVAMDAYKRCVDRLQIIQKLTGEKLNNMDESQDFSTESSTDL